MNTDKRILEDVLEMMSQLAGDWEYSGTVTEGTYLLQDLALESLDLVVLGTSIQQKYGRLPFTEFLAGIGARPADQRDVTVGEFVAFVSQHSSATDPSVAR